MLAAIAAITPTDGQSLVKPSVDFRPAAQTISRAAAMRR
jgi:hypothetical protein